MNVIRFRCRGKEFEISSTFYLFPRSLRVGTKEREGKVEKRGIIEITSGECNERNIIGGLKYKMHNRHRKKG